MGRDVGGGWEDRYSRHLRSTVHAGTCRKRPKLELKACSCSTRNRAKIKNVERCAVTMLAHVFGRGTHGQRAHSHGA